MATNYRVDRAGSSCTVTVSGALTAIVVPELREVLKKEMERPTRELVFDLRETTMLDSSGIGLLIASSNSLARAEGSIRVINPMAEIYELLSKMRLVARLNVGSEHVQG